MTCNWVPSEVSCWIPDFILSNNIYYGNFKHPKIFRTQYDNMSIEVMYVF